MMPDDLQGKQTLSLSLKRKKDEDEVYKKRRSKTNPVNVQEQLACLKVSYKAYTDIQKRFQVLYLPECVDNKCIHISQNTNVKQISPAAERDFDIEMKNRTWFEAIEKCFMCITSQQYLTENMLKSIVDIIMNAHEDSGYTVEYILRRCQHLLLLHFNIHPPCITKNIRDCYKKFLTSPMDRNEKTLSNRTSYQSEEGIVSHCFSRLVYEISMESRDDTLIDKPEVPDEICDVIRKIYWMKENFEIFEFLSRIQRIERLMVVLESLINLLQADLALWHSRCINTDSRQRSQKPLLDYVLWPSTSKNTKVTDQCQKIMKLFAYFIHLKYPEQHIKTMSLWMNTMIQMFYMRDIKSQEDYPNIDNYYCKVFTNEFCKIISPLPTMSISKIMERLEPSFMQHFIGLHHLQTIFDTKENDIITILISCVNSSWKNYPFKDNEDTLPIIDFKGKMEPHKLLDILSEKCRNHLSVTVFENGNSGKTAISYNKLDLKEETYEIHNNYLINLLFITFLAYLESYSILNFKETLECLNNSQDPSTSKEFEESCKPYHISNQFMKKYQSSMKSLEKLRNILHEKDDKSSKKLLNLINRFFSYMLFYCVHYTLLPFIT